MCGRPEVSQAFTSLRFCCRDTKTITLLANPTALLHQSSHSLAGQPAASSTIRPHVCLQRAWPSTLRVTAPMARITLHVQWGSSFTWRPTEVSTGVAALKGDSAVIAGLDAAALPCVTRQDLLAGGRQAGAQGGQSCWRSLLMLLQSSWRLTPCVCRL